MDYYLKKLNAFRTITQFRLSVFIIFGVSGFNLPALGQNGAFHAQSHLGFSTERIQRTETFETSGSSIILDLWYNHPSQYLRWGLRTVGQGSRLENKEFTRLTTGPVIAAPIEGLSSNILLYLARSSETLKTDEQTKSSSKTTTMGFGWEHEKELLKDRAWICWGIFFQRHGAGPNFQGTSAFFDSPEFNLGSTSRMVEISLRTRL